MRITRAAASGPGPFGWALGAGAPVVVGGLALLAASATADSASAISIAGATRETLRTTRADPAEDARLLKEQRAAIKRLEAELVLEPARREWAERREHLRELGRRRRGRGMRLAETKPLAVPRRTAPLALPRSPDALAVNVRVNPAPAFGTQSEVSVAAIGRTVVAAWNDGTVPTRTGPLAYGYSLDGGQTWRAGMPWPLANGVLYWESDPVVVADPVRGEFWFAALALALQPASNAVCVLRGVVADTGVVWREVGLPRAPRDTLPDKPWIAVDPLTGTAMLSYTSFFRVGTRLRDQIEFQRSEDGGHSWSPPLRLSSDAELGLVQGSRPAVGPDGEVHVVWGSVDTTEAAAGLDFMRLRTSRDGGRTFAPAVNVAGVITNFASGAPGFNRPHAINFPSIAVDHSHGPHRGRVYVAWAEAADYFAAPLNSVNPIVGHDGASTEFEVGDLLRGAREAPDPPDRFHFRGRRGGTGMFYMDSLATGLRVVLGIGCGDDPLELAYSDPPGFGRPRIAIVTFPRDGEYTLVVAPSTGGRGAYRIRTGWLRFNARRGRDVRDVFVAHSDDGRRWSEPARVSDAPPFFDDWLPEVAVGPNGHAYAAWYDWRDSPAAGCGAPSIVSLSRSVDGGHTWQWLGRLSDRPSDWATSSSNLVPNQGDYIGIVADTAGVYAGWGDGRGASPDVFFARIDPASEPGGPAPGPSVALTALRPNPTPGAVNVTYVATPGVPARLELWDVSGRRLQEETIDVPTGHAELLFTPRSGLRAGVYLLRLIQGPASTTVRLAIVP